MPNIQTFNFDVKREPTNLEKTLQSFSQYNVESQDRRRESEALSDIYKQYQGDGANLQSKLEAIQKDQRLGPTTKVNTIDQILKFQTYNKDLQEKTEKKMKEEREAKANRDQVAAIAKYRNRPEEEAKAYENDPKGYEILTRPPKGTQANQPINEDQLKRIQHVRNTPEFQNASSSKKYQMLTDAGVSRENAEAEAKVFAEDEKLDSERSKEINKAQAKADFEFVQEQTNKIPEIFNRQKTFNAAEQLNNEGVTGHLWDQAMQFAGLLQYTSEGFRQFASYAKDAVKNQNIKSIIGSQISQMEFGFFRDATISERFSADANRQILRKEMAALRYEKLYADITEKIVQENNGVIPPMMQQRVNKEFAEQSGKITQEVREAAIDFDAIQNVPKGKVLMFDKKRRPLHVPANEVEKYSKPPYGASLS